MFSLRNKKLITNKKHPHGSAGYIYFYRANNQVILLLFERYNLQKNKLELELGTFGKSDYAMIDQQISSKINFIKKINLFNEENPLLTALREAKEETNGLISTPPQYTKYYEIVTAEHSSWCNEEQAIATRIGIVPYELSTKQFQDLTTYKEFTLWQSVKTANLIYDNGRFQLIQNSLNLLDTDNLKNWRIFTRILLSNEVCSKAMHEIFFDLLPPEAKYNNPYRCKL